MSGSDWGGKRKGGSGGSNGAKGRRSGYESRSKRGTTPVDKQGFVDYSKINFEPLPWD
jgi:hypothetical protein